MAVSGRYRLPGVLDTFVTDGTPDNYSIKNVNGTTYATVVNGQVTSNNVDPVFDSNLANGRYTPTIQQSLSSTTGKSANANSATQQPASSQIGGPVSLPVEPAKSTPTPSSYSYPITRDANQDHIRFRIFKLKKSSNIKSVPEILSKPGGGKGSFGIKADQDLYEDLKYPSIILPIQASIIDQNMVNWGAGELNELQRMLVSASAKGMGTEGNLAKALEVTLESIVSDIKKDTNGYKNLLYTALLEQAVNAPNLLSRVTGGVLNPNMELLFQGPQLRPFNFTFKMSPRSKQEADTVRSIIKAFKKNMAPKVNGIFLQAPNVFKIEYVHGAKNIPHQSINLIKMCSLQNCSVDYTPLGTYMTYNDGKGGDPKASMVSYSMSLSFSEITPIYQDDYDATDTKDHPIGF